MTAAVADTRVGGCMCGAVRFTARLDGHAFGVCHCKMCQRWSGALFAAITVAKDDVAWTGTDHIARIPSSDWAERAWCTQCGSGLYYRITRDGPYAGDWEIPIGLFDDTTGLSLAREIFIDRKPEGLALAGHHPTLTEAEMIALYGRTSEGA
jgi:hypothetical protein